MGPLTEKEFEVPYDPRLTWEWLNTEELKLTWSKPPCYASFTSYELLYGPYYDQESVTVDKLLDTSLIIKPGLRFAARLDVIVYVNPYRINTYNRDYASSRNSAFIGTAFPSFFNGSVLYNQTLNKYFTLRPKYSGMYELTRFSGEDYHEEQKLEIPTGTISLSENGAHLCLVAGK